MSERVSVGIDFKLNTEEFEKQVEQIKATIDALPKFPMPVAVHEICGETVVFVGVIPTDADPDELDQHLKNVLPANCRRVVFRIGE